jgi:hypothetical protein
LVDLSKYYITYLLHEIVFILLHLPVLQANEWGVQLLAMRGPGYSATVGITPYIHVFIYHVPDMLRTYGSIAVFAGQGELILH